MSGKDNQSGKAVGQSTPSSGSGADSALEALIKKRTPHQGTTEDQPEQQPQHRAKPVPDAGT